MFINQITLVYFDNKVYSNKFSLFLLTKYIVVYCFLILNFWETFAESNYGIFLDHCLLSGKLLLMLIFSCNSRIFRSRILVLAKCNFFGLAKISIHKNLHT